MTAYAFTGPSRLTVADLARVAPTVRELVDPTMIVTGAARGWDMAVAFEALTVWPDATHRIVAPRDAVFDRDGARAWLAEVKAAGLNGSLVINSKPGYRARNETLVEVGEVLVAALRSRTFYRSGEWMTVNIARAAGTPVEVVDL